MNAAKHMETLEYNLIQSAPELQLGGRFLFQQDDDPKQTAKDWQKWFNPVTPIIANLPQTASIQNAAETVHVFPQCRFIPYIRRQNEHN